MTKDTMCAPQTAAESIYANRDSEIGRDLHTSYSPDNGWQGRVYITYTGDIEHNVICIRDCDTKEELVRVAN